MFSSPDQFRKVLKPFYCEDISITDVYPAETATRRDIAAPGSFPRLSGSGSMLAKRIEAKEFANPAIVTRNCAELCDLIM